MVIVVTEFSFESAINCQCPDIAECVLCDLANQVVVFRTRKSKVKAKIRNAEMAFREAHHRFREAGLIQDDNEVYILEAERRYAK
jgi:hypothetical protein